ncbi:MAG: hypothetical protein KA886_11045 [Candidatus Cloacimonetes bacterium]|nr:hypothetical protein [Candidatus Cloacimonadota bacterium]
MYHSKNKNTRKRFNIILLDNEKRPIINTMIPFVGEFEKATAFAPFHKEKYNKARKDNEPFADYWEVL